MANTQAQFGFLPFGEAAGSAPNFALRTRTIAYNYGTNLYRGDPVASNNAGNIIAVSSQTAPVAGIFWGCKYYDPNQKIVFQSKYWPSPSGLNSSARVEAYIIDDPNQLFYVAELGSTAAITAANIMNNVQWAAGSGGSTTSGLSSYVIDDGNITTTITLPFKIMDLYSTYAPPGVNGADNTTVYNWAIVKMNYSDRAYGTIGI
ncbi:MAG TPA: hypothetical protein VH024_17440 [Candidatus Angelobacter sp.]|jgi:hypothetical protein|nr:hypothetical protein [Candidatus Angelobacter sp.]